ncbi:undecaprenyl-diphosphate phosphatase [Alphaproteobacteria bacterium]|jgi:undecaprenyl-diphosphatase|nr:undecaprenyl-diphosphate phosphatase [Alphaproteobacteria bacterium]MDA9825285.1 undecaprenyl-diphosphate phosphatase [Alphaproteobacteria bacterium]
MPLSLLILVAAIQGLTEFLPVSSSGHLVLIPIVTDFAYQGRVIDVAAHVGTLVAVAIYLRIEIIAIAAALIRFGRNDAVNARLGIMLILATIPVIIAGYIVNYANWHWLDMVYSLAFANLIFAVILWFSDKAPATRRDLGQIGLPHALIIGIVQICALIPGASRSGVTMSAARFLGYDRVTAARFSLLLSLPTIAGAGLLKTLDLVKSGDATLGADAIIVAVLSAGLAWLAIRWMMRWFATAGFGIFVYYRLALGGLLLLALAQGWIAPSIS